MRDLHLVNFRLQEDTARFRIYSWIRFIKDMDNFMVDRPSDTRRFVRLGSIYGFFDGHMGGGPGVVVRNRMVDCCNVFNFHYRNGMLPNQ